jgi:sugar lactone lactonase YvrE
MTYIRRRDQAYRYVGRVRTFRAQGACAESYGLGEGPLWDATRQRVLWVDINAGHVHLGDWAVGKVVPRERLDFPGTVGAVVRSAAGELLVAGRRELWTVAVDGTRATGARLISAGTASRLNDGGCDPAGRFLVGGMALDDRTGQEALVRVDGREAVTVLDDDLTLSNGLAWSPDGRRMYSVDTASGVVWARHYDPTTGAVGAREEFLRVGSPDGLCVDAEGHLWIAVWGAGQVRRYSPAGELGAVVEVPAPHTTSVAFVGPNLDTLLITTARHGQFESPDAGRLFSCDVGVTGHPVAAWAGWV